MSNLIAYDSTSLGHFHGNESGCIFRLNLKGRAVVWFNGDGLLLFADSTSVVIISVGGEACRA